MSDSERSPSSGDSCGAEFGSTAPFARLVNTSTRQVAATAMAHAATANHVFAVNFMPRRYLTVTGTEPDAPLMAAVP